MFLRAYAWGEKLDYLDQLHYGQALKTRLLAVQATQPSDYSSTLFALSNQGSHHSLRTDAFKASLLGRDTEILRYS